MQCFNSWSLDLFTYSSDEPVPFDLILILFHFNWIPKSMLAVFDSNLSIDVDDGSSRSEREGHKCTRPSPDEMIIFIP